MERKITSGFPEKIDNTLILEELISRPYPETISMISRIKGDIIILGISGKIGPSLAQMIKRACDEAGIKKRIIGVSLFENIAQRWKIEDLGVETINGDLLDTSFTHSLPRAENVFYLAGMKFGSTENLALTWAINSYLPAIVSEYFNNSKIIAFSTGCVYPLVPLNSGGSVETDTPVAKGEYAQSCLGRERMFQYGSYKYKTRTALIRLNYSVELRYGVLLDIALKIKNDQPVDLEMGYFNVIWQGDMNNYVLRSLEYADSPPKIINITGPEIISVREVAIRFGQLLHKKPVFVNEEADTALLSNSQMVHEMFGKPEVQVDTIIKWIAYWLETNNEILGKPTHFEVRDGKY